MGTVLGGRYRGNDSFLRQFEKWRNGLLDRRNSPARRDKAETAFAIYSAGNGSGTAIQPGFHRWRKHLDCRVRSDLSPQEINLADFGCGHTGFARRLKALARRSTQTSERAAITNQLQQLCTRAEWLRPPARSRRSACSV